ncbi:MAG: ATP-grasp domain-containing protein [Bacteroidales bacterium]|nr:ATP-grasp domain-containing protein [Bacteroidales bacterium]
MRFLITAIGSMSAECVISKLKMAGHFVVGCDIYPKEWHYETKLCDEFYRAPYASHGSEYVKFLLDVCSKHDLSYVIPLTDLEIDVIKFYREVFNQNNIVLCMQSDKVLDIARNKYELSRFFEKDIRVPSIYTHLLSEGIPDDFRFPCIAKPYNGRSSEGLIRNATKTQVIDIENKESYIIQEQKLGDVFTVDYCRNDRTKTDVVIPRKELLRTKNGAGLTVEMQTDEKLVDLVSYIGGKLGINGCVNMEFIESEGEFYLIDINPRFSAGVGFSAMAGYDMVTNHIRCFLNEEIHPQIKLKKQIIIKRYQEVIY